MNIISGAKIIEAGEINDDRPYYVGEETLEQVVKYGNRSKRGIKARFTHPNMCSDGMGSYLGRWKNFRVEGDHVAADLHIADSAFNSPQGDIGSYVLELAQDDPEAFGVSIVAVFSQEMLDALDDLEEGERTLMLLDRLRAADIVDEPAATRGGLFDITTPQGLPEAVRWLFETHFAETDPAEIERRFFEFMGSYFEDYKPMRDDEQQLETDENIDLDGTDDIDTDDEQQPVEENFETETEVDLGEGQKYVDEFGDRGARWFLEGKSFSECQSIVIAELKQTVDDQASAIDDMQNAINEFANDGEEPLGAQTEQVDPALARRQEIMERARRNGADEKTARWTAAFGN